MTAEPGVWGSWPHPPLSIELRVAEDLHHNGCTMARRVAEHGPDYLHAWHLLSAHTTSFSSARHMAGTSFLQLYTDTTLQIDTLT